MRAPFVRFGILLALVAASGCATESPKRQVVQVASPETVAQLRDEQRETESARRYITRKQLCRNMGVRFDSSGRCW
jgi:hypothetical protein